jgi:hypothetical protein
MCQPHNQSIYRPCRDDIVKRTGRRVANREMRRIIDGNGGCMVHKVDKPKGAMVASSHVQPITSPR